MNRLFTHFREHINQWLDQPALVNGVENFHLSYRDLADLIETFGTFLDDAQVRSGERITILSESSFQQTIIILACLCNGVIANPLNPALKKNQATEFLNHANPALVLTSQPSSLPDGVQGRRIFSIDEALAKQGHTEKPQRDPARGGLLIYTSGTTGTAKAVLLSTANIQANIDIAARIFGYTPGWTSACLLPLYHTFGLVSDILPLLLSGGKVVVLPPFEMRHAKLVVDGFHTHGVNSYSGPPVVFETFLALKCLLDTRLRFTIAGAAPLHELTRTEYEKCFGHPIIPCYGLTEATCFATISPPAAIRPGSAGKPAGIEISVRDDSRELPPNELGEIALRGLSVVGEYYRDEGRFSNAFTADGWFLTGDLGRIDDDGYIYITGRKKNMVIRGGEKVYLEDLDRCLMQHPVVADSASVGITESGKPDIAVSFVVPARLQERGRRASLVEHIRTHLGHTHVPDKIVFVEKIPRSSVGKVQRVELLSIYRDLNDSL
jgi:acyl-CoA synthetase (AMP-forming)/AMP-acid ligase II